MSHVKGAAGARRSALAERVRIRAEWETLKGSTSSDILNGAVALVAVKESSRAIALRSALSALGATVAPTWSPLVTHVIWSEGGCRTIRAKARALAMRLVSPLWVEACAAAARRLPEHAFPAAARPSDLPSPRALRRMLKIAEKENFPLSILTEHKLPATGSRTKDSKLRLSSDTDNDTSHDTSADKSTGKSTDASRDKSTDVSRDKSTDASRDKSTDASRDKSTDVSRDKSTDVSRDNLPSRVNTAPRRALPLSVGSPEPPRKSRRKLFTQKEAADLSDDEEEQARVTRPKPPKPSITATTTRAKKQTDIVRVTPRQRRDLARAERMAERLARGGTAACTQPVRQLTPRIVLTGMSNTERRKMFEAIRQLNGKIQAHVNKKTTHLILGSCREDGQIPSTNHCDTQVTGTNANDEENDTCITGIEKMTLDGTTTRVLQSRNHAVQKSPANKKNILRNPIRTNSSLNQDFLSPKPNSNQDSPKRAQNSPNPDMNRSKRDQSSANRMKPDKFRTQNALEGAARGCRVLNADWVLDSAAEGRWLYHLGYEVPHLRKLSQRARIERAALGRIRHEYSYDVFCGLRVHVTDNAEQRDAATNLLKLCGAKVVGRIDAPDVSVGLGEGGIASKWVFDSVAAARVRSTRRYMNRVDEHARVEGQT